MKTLLKNKRLTLLVDVICLFSATVLLFSGLFLQIGYHLHHNPPDFFYLGLDKSEWLFMHKFAAVVFCLAVIVHLIWHKNWVKNILLQKFPSVYRGVTLHARTTVILFYITLFGTLTGLVSWIAAPVVSEQFILHQHASILADRGLIEIHDKLGLVLGVFFVIHIKHHLQWMVKQIAALFAK